MPEQDIDLILALWRDGHKQQALELADKNRKAAGK
jgi:hypothetical protein